MKKFLSFEPVRTLSALLAFGATVITGLSLRYGWSGEAATIIGGAWSGFIALVGTLFTREQVTPNAKVPELVHETIKALAPYAPTIVEATVPVAVSPLIEAPSVESPSE
jgi:hypothetical protein